MPATERSDVESDDEITASDDRVRRREMQVQSVGNTTVSSEVRSEGKNNNDDLDNLNLEDIPHWFFGSGTRPWDRLGKVP